MDWNPVNWGKKAVKGVGSVAGAWNRNVNVLNPAVTQKFGTNLGNLISRNPVAERAVLTSGRLGGERLANTLYEQSGVKNFQEGVRRAGQGNIGGALSVAGTGALKLGVNAATLAGGAGAARGAVAGARSGAGAVRGATQGLRGTSLVSSGAQRLGARVPALARPARGVANVALPAGAAVTAADWWAAGGTGKARPAVAATRPGAKAGSKPASAADFRRFEEQQKGTSPAEVIASAAAGKTGKGKGKGKSKGKGKGKTGAAAPAVAAPAAPTQPAVDEQLDMLDPQELEQILSMTREAEKAYQEELLNIGAETDTAQRSFTDFTRRSGRQVAGGTQDVMSALAQLGMDEGPIASNYADYLAGQGAQRVESQRAQLGEVLTGLRERRGRAEAGKLSQLEAIRRQEAAMRAGRTTGRAARFVQ
jgi:hypothetical protein